MTFLPPNEKGRGITAIVGPNGSGKSNCVDAFRWVLGEQSVKLLRGKKTEDIIFNGSQKKPRSGFAEVSLILNNEDFSATESSDETKINVAEEKETDDLTGLLNTDSICITRRVYRDGASDYLLGKNKTRLSDIQMLLARMGVGTKTYGIIGQGMIDSILAMSDAEKKEFFDEATGIKQYQIKKNQSLLQLKNASSNMREALTIINEIEPHLKYLKRQVHRLEEKEKIEEDLHSLEHIYYGNSYRKLTSEIAAQKSKIKEAENELSKKMKEMSSLEKTVENVGYLHPQSAITELQTEYQKILEEKSKIKEEELQLKNKIWQLSQKTQSASMPYIEIADIFSKIKELDKIEREIAQIIEKGELNLKNLALKSNEALLKTREVIDFLKKYEAGPGASAEEKNLVELKNKIETFERKTAEIKNKIDEACKKEEAQKNNFVKNQKELQEKRIENRSLESRLNDLKIELARGETRLQTLETEMETELKERVERIKNVPTAADELPSDTYQKIQKLKYQMALAGGVDEQIVKEYNETNERYTFLKNQTDDLEKSIANLKNIIDELDEIMEGQFNKSFNQINGAFGKYFKMLFGGGAASLAQKEIKEDAPEDASAAVLENASREEKTEKYKIENFIPAQKYIIEINAAPPGKKVKSIQMLSGGERALTAIALICGIISSNPSPFIILDEVDAALDETNSIKFSNILKELSEQSQFVVITHNRATMENASLLYGVTMGDDGTSKLLSINLEDAEKIVSR